MSRFVCSRVLFVLASLALSACGDDDPTSPAPQIAGDGRMAYLGCSGNASTSSGHANHGTLLGGAYGTAPLGRSGGVAGSEAVPMPRAALKLHECEVRSMRFESMF